MCGRFLFGEEAYLNAAAIAHMPQWIQEELHFGEIYPSQSALVLKKNQNGDGLEGAVMKFGYSYTRAGSDRKQLIINARSETVDSKWMFRWAFLHERVVVVASAFYEWTADKQKVTYYEPDQTLYIGAIAKDDGFVILTKEANASVRDVHHRMPVLFDTAQAKIWVERDDLAKDLMDTVSPLLDHSPIVSLAQGHLF